MSDFTERQVRILHRTSTYVAVNGEAPSLRGIAAEIGLSSPSSGLYQMERLESVGAVRRHGEARRAGVTDVLTVTFEQEGSHE
ncbi:hypothetical protein GCM10010271_45550 [Streptomyces kurssanovii]|nr:hypothetical protein GCM10010271_45550 [Streptomyces kurssanovii]